MFSTLWLGIMLFAATAVEPSARWSGMLEDVALRKQAPAAGFVADAKSFEKLWKAWRPSEKVPKVDFATDFVLVGTVSGPNLVIMSPSLGDNGDLKYVVGGTKRGGPGFGYLILQVSRKGVKTVNGKPLAEK